MAAINCLANLGREQEALQLLRTLAEIPKDELNNALLQLGESIEVDVIGFELGSLEAKYGHLDEAAKLLTSAVEHYPKHREARYQLARTLKALGRSDEAQKHFDWYQETQEKTAEINRVLDEVKRNPLDLDLRCRLGALYLEVGSEKAGVFWLKGVLAEDPDHLLANDALAKYRAVPLPSLR